MYSPSPRNEVELGKPVTQPFFLLFMGLSPAIRISSRGPTTWAGQTWAASYLDVGGLVFDDYGLDRCTVRVSPDFREAILRGEFYKVGCELYMLFGIPPYANADGIQLLKGYGSGVVRREYVDISLASRDSNTSSTPRVYYDHQNIQPAGTKVVLQNTTITLNRFGQ